MADSFTETTSQGWFSRIIGSIKSVLVGLVLFMASFPVLFCNEGQSVQTAKSLAEGRGAVVSVDATTVDASKEGRLVHLSGQAKTEETLTDPDFGVSVNALKLIRNVEMYQWEEEKESKEEKKLGGGTETRTTYTYKKTWSSGLIDSSNFKEQSGHENPSSMDVEGTTVEGRTITASAITLGAFTLSEPVVSQLDQTENAPVDESTLPAKMQSKVKAAGDGYYGGGDPSAPAIGDLRITFQKVPPATVTLVARQVSSTFEAFPTKAGNALLMVRYGTLSADGMFTAAESDNAILTWILRFVGFFIMFLGLVMIFRPIAVFADVIPLFGTLLGAGIGVFAGLTAVVLSLVTIALSWIFFRPLLGITLLVLAIGGVVLLVRVGLKKRQARATAAQHPPAVNQGAA